MAVRLVKGWQYISRIKIRILQYNCGQCKDKNSFAIIMSLLKHFFAWHIDSIVQTFDTPSEDTITESHESQRYFLHVNTRWSKCFGIQPAVDNNIIFLQTCSLRLLNRLPWLNFTFKRSIERSPLERQQFKNDQTNQIIAPARIEYFAKVFTTAQCS